MEAQIFINLAVQDLTKSFNFYSKMGFSNNPQFSDDSAKCMVWSEHIFVMIMTKERFKTFTSKPIADTKNNIAGLFSISVESVDKMNQIADNALNAGGLEPIPPKDYGFMQQRSVEDFDGHSWEIFYMDMSKFPKKES